jgi:hypothetical protein
MQRPSAIAFLPASSQAVHQTLVPFSVVTIHFLFCALQTAGENDNSENWLLERRIKAMPLLTGLFYKSLLIRQIRERAKRHGFYGMR